MKKLIALIAVFCIFAWGLYAQEISEKQDLSIFRANYYGAPVEKQGDSLSIKAQIGKTSVELDLTSSGNMETDRIFRNSIGAVDAGIRQVFQNLGRFNIIAMPQRVSTSNVTDFISAIQDYRQQGVEIPEAVRLGQEAFTESDLNRIINSFIMVVPEVTYYDINIGDVSLYEATIVTSFSIFNVEDYSSIAEFSVESTGYSDDKQEAMRLAVEDISDQLEFEIRSVEQFRLKSAILERRAGRIILEFGRNMGIRVGDEYEVTRIRDLGGKVFNERVGLLRIREVNQEFSIASVMYEKERIVAGDQVKEIPRIGFDVTPYVAAIFNLESRSISSISFGARAAPSRGFYAFRPVAGVEIVLSNASTAGEFIGLPVSVNFGAEYNLFLRRLRLTPHAYLGLVGQIPLQEGDDFALKALKTGLVSGLSYLLPSAADNIELYLEGGYELQFGFESNPVSGISLGAGVRIR
ncbi:hypothetical protein [Salinispira pacifica]|uniref:Uncharacterized protein n=1 Tax=Salinispira pacifica TaxID=1307761 RepID=V5WD21_9SPIO|nr:hypothetical protein [Salinispira pacifica]AHC13687.1 hypothetical protein L21SP2_0245 [Salinispira pacifica]